MVVLNYINARQSKLSYNLDYQLCHSLAGDSEQFVKDPVPLLPLK